MSFLPESVSKLPSTACLGKALHSALQEKELIDQSLMLTLQQVHNLISEIKYKYTKVIDTKKLSPISREVAGNTKLVVE